MITLEKGLVGLAAYGARKLFHIDHMGGFNSPVSVVAVFEIVLMELLFAFRRLAALVLIVPLPGLTFWLLLVLGTVCYGLGLVTAWAVFS